MHEESFVKWMSIMYVTVEAFLLFGIMKFLKLLQAIMVEMSKYNHAAHYGITLLWQVFFKVKTLMSGGLQAGLVLIIYPR